MFTGIIVACGRVLSNRIRNGESRMLIDSGKFDLGDAQIGESIAVNGVCLTVVELGPRKFGADVSVETLKRTTLAKLDTGNRVNLEPSLTPTSKLGGHFVSGHVDGTGIVVEKKEQGQSVRFVVRAPDPLAKYIAEKGSICVDGVSLTVNGVVGSDFSVNIIPHTLTETTLGDTAIGACVNLEVDLLARYLERLMVGNDAAGIQSAVSMELLKKSGFITQS